MDLAAEEKKPEDYRYVIYVRKSTESAEKQECSIRDQINECKNLASRVGLRWVDIVAEEKSARDSGKRPAFRKMLDDVVAGKYDGILVWSPDRLARNMKEGGEVIDMLDRGIIRDLRFANGFVYSNDSTGKMLLGIAFVMAKQYSDQRSADANRGIKSKTNEGKFLGTKPKHGYYKDKNKRLRPDGENWEIVSTAFKMRLQDKKLAEIAKYMKDAGYRRKARHTKPKEYKYTEQFVSKILRDPFYAGILVFGKYVVPLAEHYDFTPIITPAEWERICKEDGEDSRYRLAKVAMSDEKQANLMRGMVVCGDCSQPFSSGLTSKRTKTGKLTTYYYYRCNTPECPFRNKSVRAKVVVNAAIEYYKAHPFSKKKGYEIYKKDMEKQLQEAGKVRKRELTSLKAQRVQAKNRVAEVKVLLKDETMSLLKKEYRQDMNEQLQKVKEIDASIKKIKHDGIAETDAIAAYSDFLELFENLAKRIQNIGSMSDLDFIMRKLFSNFLVRGGKVTKITQNSPFRELCLDADSAMVTPRGIEPRFPG